MQTDMTRPNRRPKLFLPLALAAQPELTGRAMPFPLTPDQLRRSVAERIG
jgi:hypothetical protein